MIWWWLDNGFGFEAIVDLVGDIVVDVATGDVTGEVVEIFDC